MATTVPIGTYIWAQTVVCGSGFSVSVNYPRFRGKNAQLGWRRSFPSSAPKLCGRRLLSDPYTSHRVRISREVG